MSATVVGALVGATAGLGLLLVLVGAPLRRRPSLDDRVLAVPDRSDRPATQSGGPLGVVSVVVVPWLHALAQLLRPGVRQRRRHPPPPRPRR